MRSKIEQEELLRDCLKISISLTIPQVLTELNEVNWSLQSEN